MFLWIQTIPIPASRRIGDVISLLDHYIFDSTDISIKVSLDYRNQVIEKLMECDENGFDKPQTLFGAYKYHIKIEIPGCDPVSIEKRYSDLESFYTSLITKFPYVILPSFPPKDLLMKYKKDEEKIKARRAGLQSFFSKLSTNSVLLNTNYLTVLQQYKFEGKSPKRAILDSANNLLELFDGQR